MGITYGDHLIDSGYYDITPEQEREMQEREIEERKGTEMTDLEYYEGLLAEVVRERENYNAMHQAACLEIDRLQDAKRRALKLAVGHEQDLNRLRDAIRRLAREVECWRGTFLTDIATEIRELLSTPVGSVQESDPSVTIDRSGAGASKEAKP